MEHDRTIYQAAANMLREAAIDRARADSTLPLERRAVVEALFASISITNYLATLDELDRPF